MHFVLRLLSLPFVLGLSLASCSTHEEASIEPPPLKAVPPRTFSVVSGAGPQRATHLHAVQQTCTQEGNSFSCSLTATVFYPASELSVVRPGETLRLVLRRPLPPDPHGFSRIESYVANPICGGGSFLHPPKIGFFENGSWKVNLPPGQYSVTLTVRWHEGARSIDEDGVVGLWVSDTEPLRIVKAPGCEK